MFFWQFCQFGMTTSCPDLMKVLIKKKKKKKKNRKKSKSIQSAKPALNRHY
jgi:hypothetical protein